MRKIASLAAVTALSVALLALLSCSSEEVDPAAVEKARATLKPFKGQLFAALTESLDKGPRHAIEVCRKRAPEIAAGLSVDGIRMGRTSHRLRNPQNAPQPWLKPLLEEYIEHPEERQPRAVRLTGNRLGYVEPIYVNGLCLTCHGEQVDSSVETIIDRLYPDDQATGFQVDGFRGLFWVTMPLGE